MMEFFIFFFGVSASIGFPAFIVWLLDRYVKSDADEDNIAKDFYRDINRPPYTSITALMTEEQRLAYSERQYEREMRTRNEELEKGYSEEKLEWLESCGVVTERMKRKQEMERSRNKFGIPSERYE